MFEKVKNVFKLFKKTNCDVGILQTNFVECYWPIPGRYSAVGQGLISQKHRKDKIIVNSILRMFLGFKKCFPKALQMQILKTINEKAS